MPQQKYLRSQTNNPTSHKISSEMNNTNSIDENIMKEYCRKIVKEEIDKIQHSRSSKSIYSSSQPSHTTYNTYREKYQRQATSEMLRRMIGVPFDGVDFKSPIMENTIKKISNGIAQSILNKI